MENPVCDDELNFGLKPDYRSEDCLKLIKEFTKILNDDENEYVIKKDCLIRKFKNLKYSGDVIDYIWRLSQINPKNIHYRKIMNVLSIIRECNLLLEDQHYRREKFYDSDYDSEKEDDRLEKYYDQLYEFNKKEIHYVEHEENEQHNIKIEEDEDEEHKCVIMPAKDLAEIDDRLVESVRILKDHLVEVTFKK